VHIFGFRDPVGTATAAWCRARRVPYLFEALGMFEPKLRKVKLKRAIDATIVRHVAGGAAQLVAASEVERREYLAAGASEDRIAVRPNGFPRVVERAPTGGLRRRLGLGRETPLVLSVGRMARGKGLDLLVGAMPRLDGAHLAVVGPDDGHGVVPELRSQSESLGVAERVHLVGALDSADLPGVYADADVFALASRHENFGMVAAEAASVGTPVLVTDRCGVSELLGEAAIVVPYDAGAVGDGLARLLGDADLRVRLGVLAREVARTWSWDAVTLLEESLLRSIVHP
jgi:glycosyltransferase involved in cell wall biosynthesis